MNSIQLDWPKFSDDEHREILSEFSKYKKYAFTVKAINNDFFSFNALNDENNHFIALYQWPNKESFCKKLFKVSLKEYMPFLLSALCIQQSHTNLLPHYDEKCKFSLLYVVQGCAETNFYKKKIDLPQDDKIECRMFLYKDLIKTETHQFKIGSWNTFNNSCIHGVSNYQGIRTTVKIDVSNQIFNIKDYSDLIKNLPILQKYFNRT